MLTVKKMKIVDKFFTYTLIPNNELFIPGMGDKKACFLYDI
jgi:hypothetical protein